MRRPLALTFTLSVSLLAGCATKSPPEAADQVVTDSTQQQDAAPDTASLFIGAAASHMDDQAKADYLAAQTAALDGGSKATIGNTSMGVTGSVKVGPSPLTALHSGMECQRYSSVVWVLGTGQLVEGDACREKGGQWQAMGIRKH
jgi:surface antigen